MAEFAVPPNKEPPTADDPPNTDEEGVVAVEGLANIEPVLAAPPNVTGEEVAAELLPPNKEVVDVAVLLKTDVLPVVEFVIAVTAKFPPNNDAEVVTGKPPPNSEPLEAVEPPNIDPEELV